MTESNRIALLEQRAAARTRLLERLDDEEAARHADRLRRCGEPIALQCTCCNARKTAYRRCDLKWCPSCAPRLAYDKGNKYGPVVDTFRSPLFVTFTTQNFDARSKKTTGTREVRRAFTRLRAQRWWKRSVAGGVASLEMTRRRKGWHPHIHALLDSRWFAVTVTAPPIGSTREQFKARARAACQEVAAQWTMALGGRAGSVKVRKITPRAGQTIAQCLREVMKYSITAESLENITGGLTLFLDELALTRNLVSFGSAYRHPALKKQPKEPAPCADCGETGTMLPLDVINRFADSMTDSKTKLRARADSIRLETKRAAARR